MRILVWGAMISVIPPSEAKELSREYLELANLYSKLDPYSSMLHCRRSLEVVMHHLLDEKNPARDSDLKLMCNKIKFVNPENQWKYWRVNQISSAWIHWTPEVTHSGTEVEKCIRIMGEILEDVFGMESWTNQKGFSILDSFTRNLPGAIGALALGRGV